MRYTVSYDQLYTKPSASLVVLERHISKSGQDPDTSNDLREKKGITAFIGYGSQYAYPRNSTPHGRPSVSYHSLGASYHSKFKQPLPNFSQNIKANVRCFRCKTLGHYRN